MSSKLLFLEDDTLFRESIVEFLEDEGFEVLHYSNGQDALDATFSHKFDLYLLDINVPLINGISFLSELRESGDNTPAIFLTSYKDKKMLEKGFNSGADDFIKKPFDLDELLWRLQALLKRSGKETLQKIGSFEHDGEHKTISYNSKVLELSNKEYILLLLFLRHVNSNVPKELILEELWSHSDTGSDGAIRVYINRLKQLLPGVDIENIRGIGYRLVQ